MTSYTQLEFHQKERIAYLSLNRPEQKNTLTPTLVAELKHALAQVEQSQDLKVVVIRGNGAVFCAGADLPQLESLQQQALEENLKDANHLADLYLMMYRSSKVIIAQVEGPAFGSGMGLVSVCDFAFAVPEALLGYPEVKYGFVPSLEMVFLLRKVGETRTKELLLGGEALKPEQAVSYGLINAVVPADDMREHVFQLASRICNQNSAASLQLIKKMVADIPNFPVDQGLRFAAKMNAHARGTEDFRKGIQAFLSNEKLEW
jgi:methylglutaconyl-CoA hydratase